MDVNRKFTTKFVSEVFLELRIFLHQISTSVFDFLAALLRNVKYIFGRIWKALNWASSQKPNNALA